MPAYHCAFQSHSLTHVCCIGFIMSYVEVKPKRVKVRVLRSAFCRVWYRNIQKWLQNIHTVRTKGIAKYGYGFYTDFKRIFSETVYFGLNVRTTLVMTSTDRHNGFTTPRSDTRQCSRQCPFTVLDDKIMSTWNQSNVNNASSLKYGKSIKSNALAWTQHVSMYFIPH